MGNKRNDTTGKQSKISEASLANLKHFKPGQSGNPKGRPKSILSKRERLELLSELSKINRHKANPVEAIREINRMEHVYTDFPAGLQDNRQYNIYIQGGDDAKARLERLLAGERPKKPTGEAPRNDT